MKKILTTVCAIALILGGILISSGCKSSNTPTSSVTIYRPALANYTPEPYRLYLRGNILDSLLDNTQTASNDNPVVSIPSVSTLGDCADHGNLLGSWQTAPLNIAEIPSGDWHFRFYAQNVNILQTCNIIVSVWYVHNGTPSEFLAESRSVTFGATPSLYEWTTAGPANPIAIDPSDSLLFRLYEYKIPGACGGTGMIVHYDAIVIDSSIDAPIAGYPTVTPTP